MKMSAGKRAVLLLAALISGVALPGAFFTGCSSASSYNAALSDLGGVYSVSFNDIDFKIELSGRLSEDMDKPSPSAGESGETGQETYYAAISGISDNKLLRWGISRRSNHETPAADPGAPELLAKYGAAYVGDTSEKTIYLTFDEGYENGYTPMILDTLRDNGVHAIFFITGPYLRMHQDLVRRMVEEGHIVGNHTIHHHCLPELGDSQLEEEVLGLERAFKEKFGKDMLFLRPPKGEYSERTLVLTQKLGYCNLFWSFAYDDWYRDKIRGSRYAYDIVMRNLHGGAVILLHAVSKDNAEALDSIIKGAVDSGYSIGDPLKLLPDRKAGDGSNEEG